MAPATRARGAAPPSSRVYNSSPSLQQVQFPARRKTVRLPRNQGHNENEDEDGTTVSSSAALKLKQETLTQIGFVHSSFEERYEGLECGDSEMDEMQEDPAKENLQSKNKKKKKKKLEEEKAKEDEEPPVSTRRRKRKSDTKVRGGKRRRTLGDGEVNRLKEDQDDEDEDDVVDRKSRRKTLGDMPSSRYHTQTLTQFMGRDHHPLLVLDSDDEPDSLPNDGFDAWLNNPNDQPIPPSSSPNKQEQPHTRQSSIVPQTPTKPIRTEVPSSSQQVTPLSGMMLERYGAPNAMHMSPSSAVAARRTRKVDEQGVDVNAGPTPVTGTPLRRKLVVEDSYASEEVFFTPSKGMMAERPFAGEVELGDEVVEVASSSHGGTTPTPKRTSSSQSARKWSSSVKRVRISSASPLKSSPKKAAVADGRYEIPDSEEEDIDYEEEGEQVDEQQETFTAGDETQFVMDQMAVQEASAIETTISSSPPLTRTTSRPQPANNTNTESKTDTKSPLPKLPSPPPPKLLRKPLPPPPLASTQPFESQRLPTSLVQSFPPAAHRTDAILSLPSASITQLTSGYKTCVTLPFRTIHTVVRFWFWDGTEIKYGASLGEEIHRKGGGGNEWEYPLAQMYELNNPLDEAELVLEGIFCRKITTCGYMPPSIASGMLWNIARALFPENSLDLLNDPAEEEEETTQDDTTPTKTAAPPSRTQGSTASGPPMTVSQEVAAQLESDVAHSTTQFPSDQILVPSTPEDHKPTPRPRPRPHHPSQENARPTTSTTTIRPSQATTASQCSTPSPTKPSHPHPSHDDTPLPPPAFPRTNSSDEKTDNNNGEDGDDNMEGKNTLAIPSSSSLNFQEYSAPSPIAPHLLVPLGSSSQLLSKSQMLSDSLLREDDDDEDEDRI